MFGWDPSLPCILTDKLLDSEGPWRNFDVTQFWHRITEEEAVHNSRNAKATSIMHPALRYFHRLLVQALFSRKELGQIRSYELLLLWLATEGNRPEIPKPNFGYILIQRFLQINKGVQSWSDIVLGGMITHILRQLGADPAALCTDPTFLSTSPSLLGIAELKRAQFLRETRRQDPKYLYLVKKMARSYLPNPDFFPLRREGIENPWSFYHYPIEDRDLNDAERAMRAAMDNEDDDEEGEREEAEQQMEMDPPLAPPNLGGGTSSSSSTPSPFDFVQFRSAFDEFSTQMRGAFTDLTEEVRCMRRENQVFHHNAYNAINRLGADIDMTRRIAWRSHLGRAEEHPTERFPNYPEFPPQFDPRGGLFHDPPPPYDFSSYPWQPFPPPPEGGQGGQ